MLNDKSIFRKEMLVKRAAMDPSARADANRKILAALTSLPEYLAADMIFCYVSVADEPDTFALFDDAWARGKRVCAPLCLSMGVMQAREITGPDDLIAGKYDIPEPKSHCLIVPPEDIDLNLVPCVCCDSDGYRLGYGGGFYDRWLENRSAPAVVICFENMIVTSVPREQHDQRADILITDADVRTF